MEQWNKACLPCRLVHTTCDGKRPCRRCVKLGKPSTCINVEKKRRGRPPKNRPATVAASNPATVASTAHGPQKNLGGNSWENAATQRAMRPRKQPAQPYYDDSYGERRSSNRRRVSVRRGDAATFSPSSSSGEEDDDDDDDSKDDDDYRDYRSSAVAGKKRKMPLPEGTATAPAVDTTSDTITKRPRAQPQEQPPAHSGPVSPEAAHEGCVDDEQLPLLLDPVYSWIDDLDPIGVATTDSDAFLSFPVVDVPFAMISQPQPLPSSLDSSSPQPPLSLSLSTQPPQQPPIAPASCDDAYPPLPSPSFEFRDGFDHEYDGFDAEDGHDHDHDHDCTCSSPHSTSSISGDAADAQLVKSLFGMMTDQVGELKKANEDLRESIDTLWLTFNERLDREEKRVSDLSQLMSTRLSSSLADEPAPTHDYPRPELFRELPFLLDWADDIDFANPDGFVIDDMNKPFIVRRLFEPNQDGTPSLPVSIYANPAFCNFTRTAPHEIVGTLCYKAQDEPLRWFLAKKCPRPVGDLCFLPLVRPIGGRMVQSLTKNQLFYDCNGIAKLWILVVERFVGPTEEPAALPVSAFTPCPQPRDETCEGQHRKAEQSTDARVS